MRELETAMESRLGIYGGIPLAAGGGDGDPPGMGWLGWFQSRAEPHCIPHVGYQGPNWSNKSPNWGTEQPKLE